MWKHLGMKCYEFLLSKGSGKQIGDGRIDRMSNVALCKSKILKIDKGANL